MTQPDTNRQTNALAIAALAFSCGSVVLGPAGFIPGIILGFMSLRQLRDRPGQDGRGIAISAIAAGFVFAALSTLVLGAVHWRINWIQSTFQGV